ncbi:MAG: hypothetical protein ACRBDI_04655 [Alphaproteobacteria bacterium]
MSKEQDQNVSSSVQEAVKKIGRIASSGHYVCKKTYESKSYGDLTIVTLSNPKKAK